MGRWRRRGKGERGERMGIVSRMRAGVDCCDRGIQIGISQMGSGYERACRGMSCDAIPSFSRLMDNP